MAFIENGRPNPRSADEILNDMMAEAEEAFGRAFSDDEAVVMRSFYRPAAEYLAQQEQDLANVLNSAQIDYAEGEALDLLAGLIGVERLSAAAASTRLQFQNDDPVGRDYVIPSGTGAQTDSSSAVKFETDTSTSLLFLDGFEDGDISEYSGDTGTFSVQTATVYEGSNALEAAASTGEIINTDDTIENGSRLHARFHMDSGTSAGLMFGVDNTDNYYNAILDSSSGEIRLELTEGGSTSTVGSTSVTVPTSEWVHVELDWQHDGNYVITLYDASGSEVGVLETDEAEAVFVEGGFGFSSLDGSGTKRFDNATMSSTSVDATATVAGSDTNVGNNTAIILSGTVSGVNSVTNPIPATGGRDEEEDDQYRIRAKRQLSEGVRATLPALISRLQQLEETGSVTVIANDTDSTDGDGRPAHAFEAIVTAPPESYDAVADRILNTKAAGDPAVGGYAGTSVTRTLTLENGQSKDITFSTPTEIKIYVDCELSKTDTYAGDSDVQDSIVSYIGGVLNAGGDIDGEINAGDDVIYNQVLEAIMDVEGVHDVTSLAIGTSASPTGESNITIASTEVANADATDGTVTITSSDA